MIGSNHSPFDAVVFAGGGCRCFWQAGFWSVAAPKLGLVPDVVVGVSAGSAFACAALTGRIDDVLHDFKSRVAANPRNLYPRNVLRGERMFPHEGIYRGTILENLDDEAFEQLLSGPELRVLMARSPSWLGRGGVPVAAFTHLMNRRERLVHARWGVRMGFRPEVVSVRSCASRAELADLILHSSCVPPLTPLYRRDGAIALDGGLLDNAPADLVGRARSILVLLSYRFSQRLPQIERRTYVQPSRPIPISEWDYTSPGLVQETFDLGRRDGESFAHCFGRRARRVPAASSVAGSYGSSI